MADENKALAITAKKNAEGLASLKKSVDGIVDKLSKLPAPGHPNASQVFGTPWARSGENSLSSRGFSFLKMMGLLTGDIGPENAKTEMDVHNRLHNIYVKDGGAQGYQYRGGGIPGMPGGKFLAPLATGYMQEDVVPREFRNEMKQLVHASIDGADHDEMKWIRTKQLQAQGYGRKDLSWLNEFTGGALVAPPEFGELIELLRNKEALINAGARTVPLPPQGRMKFPRQTAASNTYWVGENQQITQSDIGTGEVTLQAKKLAVLIKAPNELIRFASPAAEALLRDDMTKSLALGLDLAGLEGNGTDTRPRGVINMPLINTIVSSTTGANGDRVVGQDVYRMIAAVEESNAEFEGFIMRPKTLYKYYQLRASAVAQGDSEGPFLYNLIREAGEGVQATLGGHPVTKSTQISQVRAKGSATNLSYIVGGMWSDLLIGMFGAIEFAATTLGDTAFQNDQTWVRGILSADIAARHEAAFVLLDVLDTTL
ncbi:MAG: phage major capsid protein [Dehalococcoidia bacterium]|nr:phage major capsid protein [Dehalococcoidia bacterium]